MSRGLTETLSRNLVVRVRIRSRHLACVSSLDVSSSRRDNEWRRSFSSSSQRGGGRDSRGFELDALPFSVSPQQALDKFYAWATDEQGLNYILQQNSVRIGAAYLPVWSFDVNVRFVVTDKDGRKRFGWKPGLLEKAYANQSVVHIPGLSAYAGYTYRRSLVNPLHNTSLVFLGSETVPFGNWMLRDMKFNGHRMEIFPDPWNATRGRSFAIIKEELLELARQGEIESEGDFKVDVQTEVVSSRRVYMPTYVVDYKVLGVEYRAFVSGCDAGAAVSGDSHKVFDMSNEEVYNASRGVLSQAFGVAQTGARVLGGRGIFVLLQLFGGIISRLLVRLPFVGFFAGIFVGFRKIVQPWISRRTATAEWERQREHEAYMEDTFDHSDDFADSGAAQNYFRSNRGRILRHLSGESDREQGDFDWYKQWEAWARDQWQKQQQQGGSQQGYQQQTHRKAKSKKQQEYVWDFDPSDP